MIDGVQPMSTYGFLLYNLPRFNPFQQHTHRLETDVDTTGFSGLYNIQFKKVYTGHGRITVQL